MAFVGRLRERGVRRIAIADTYGVATPEVIQKTLEAVVRAFGPEGIGAHLHARPEGVVAKVDAVLAAGVRWLEGALAGIGGCPFAGDALVGNLATEVVLPHLARRGFASGVRLEALPSLAERAAQLRTTYA